MVAGAASRQIPERVVIAEEMDGDVIRLEGQDLVAVEIGHTDTHDTTVLHVPAIGLVVAGDAAYNGVHQLLAETDAQKRREWIAALDKVESLSPRVVIAGHKRPGNEDHPRIIEETQQYIRDFDRLVEKDTTAASYTRPQTLTGKLQLSLDEKNGAGQMGPGLQLPTHHLPQSRNKSRSVQQPTNTKRCVVFPELNIIPSPDFQLLHFRIQGCPLHAEPCGGAIRSSDLALGFSQHPQNMISFGRLKRWHFFLANLFISLVLQLRHRPRHRRGRY